MQNVARPNCVFTLKPCPSLAIPQANTPELEWKGDVSQIFNPIGKPVTRPAKPHARLGLCGAHSRRHRTIPVHAIAGIIRALQSSLSLAVSQGRERGLKAEPRPK